MIKIIIVCKGQCVVESVYELLQLDSRKALR